MAHCAHAAHARVPVTAVLSSVRKGVSSSHRAARSPHGTARGQISGREAQIASGLCGLGQRPPGRAGRVGTPKPRRWWLCCLRTFASGPGASGLEKGLVRVQNHIVEAPVSFLKMAFWLRRHLPRRTEEARPARSGPQGPAGRRMAVLLPGPAQVAARSGPASCRAARCCGRCSRASAGRVPSEWTAPRGLALETGPPLSPRLWRKHR